VDLGRTFIRFHDVGPESVMNGRFRENISGVFEKEGAEMPLMGCLFRFFQEIHDWASGEAESFFTGFSRMERVHMEELNKLRIYDDYYVPDRKDASRARVKWAQIEFETDVNLTDKRDLMGLMDAALHGHSEMIREMVEDGEL